LRVAVISDIHANLHAFESVLAAIDADAPDAIWCLGDLVGYGPRPNECVELARDRSDLCLAGNHDLAVIGALDLSEFSGDAGAAVRWTRGVLEDRHRAFLGELPSSSEASGVGLFHGSPRDPVWEYVLSESAAAGSFRKASQSVILVGHSHVALALTELRSGVAGGLAPDGTDVDLTSGRWLLNPGSIGQPRDGDPRAAFLLLDLDARFAEFRRVHYPVERTQAEIRERGLPRGLAERLARGE
jgi:diadenosine tetraphosphatase ApaH/serine/threonine PP2A family protein phosphatase